MPLGIVHGALVVVTLTVRPVLGWGMGVTLLALLAAVLPLGPFVFHFAKRGFVRLNGPLNPRDASAIVWSNGSNRNTF